MKLKYKNKALGKIQFHHKIETEALKKQGVEAWVLRLDLLHWDRSGNKYYKLKYNLGEARKQGFQQVLSFGGAFSNHIYALAAAAKSQDLKSIGIIRGEEVLPLNSTLAFARHQGMQLDFVSREEYRRKKEADYIEGLRQKWGSFYLIPEGGSNVLALKGLREIHREIQVDWDYLICPVGTGATMAGLLIDCPPSKKVVGMSVLKGGGFLKAEVESFLKDYSATQTLANGKIDWGKRAELILDYHFGGYARQKPALKEFIQDFQKKHRIPIERVYSAKMFYGFFDLLKQGYFPSKSRVLLLHTGGLRPDNYQRLESNHTFGT